MKISYEKYKEYISTLDRQTLEQLAAYVVVSAYGTTFSEEERGLDDELDALGLKDGDIYIDSDHDTENVDFVCNVLEDLESAGLAPEQVAERMGK